jgi:murein DD-endopeptidase MepM/ murein hydrolase activator NlpD
MNLERITEKTRVWTPNLDIVLPINGGDIPEFSKWVNWSGWKGYNQKHEGFDFACYINKNGDYVIGLPERTPVRAIADGEIFKVSRGLSDYSSSIILEHAESRSGLFSGYHHVKPLVKDGKKVKKGAIIATLHKDISKGEGRLVHLHFELENVYETGRPRKVNPEEIYELAGKAPKAMPQGSIDFTVDGIKPNIVIAHFTWLRVNISDNSDF